MRFSDRFLMWKHNTYLGQVSKTLAGKMGRFSLKIARRLFLYSLKYCSWCGSDCGFDSTISRKGLRCSSNHRNCVDF